MRDIHGCDCDTTLALISKDKSAIIEAVKDHETHNCPNFLTAMQVVIKELAPCRNKDLMPG